MRLSQQLPGAKASVRAVPVGHYFVLSASTAVHVQVAEALEANSAKYARPLCAALPTAEARAPDDARANAIASLLATEAAYVVDAVLRCAPQLLPAHEFNAHLAAILRWPEALQRAAWRVALHPRRAPVASMFLSQHREKTHPTAYPLPATLPQATRRALGEYLHTLYVVGVASGGSAVSKGMTAVLSASSKLQSLDVNNQDLAKFADAVPPSVTTLRAAIAPLSPALRSLVPKLRKLQALTVRPQGRGWFHSELGSAFSALKSQLQHLEVEEVVDDIDGLFRISDAVSAGLRSLTRLTSLTLKARVGSSWEPSMYAAVGALSSLREASFNSCEAQGLLKGLAKIPSVTKLYLESAHLDQEAHADVRLGRAIGALRNLQALTVVSCAPDKDDEHDYGTVANVLAGMTTLSKLTSLIMRSNKIDDRAAFGATARMLAAMPKLEELELSENNASVGRDEGTKMNAFIDAIAPALRNIAPQLRLLALHGNTLGRQGVARLPEVLAPASRLTCLKLHGNSIGARGAAHLGSAVPANAPLAELWLGGNMLGGSGVADVFAATVVLASLTKLDMRESGPDGLGAPIRRMMHAMAPAAAGITNAGASAMFAQAAEAATADARAQGAALAGKGDIGARFAPLLSQFPVLRELGVQGCELSAAGLRKLAAAVHAGQCITKLQLSFNKLGVRGAAALEPLFAERGEPITVELHQADIDDSAAEKLADEAATCEADVTFRFGSCKFSAAGRRALAPYACYDFVTVFSSAQWHLPEELEPGEC